MKTVSLCGAWALKGRREGTADECISLTASVPGCVQLDLSREGYLPADLFMGENILEAEKYEDYEWWYERSFTAPEDKKNVYLVFEGVDCIAEYYLNGVKFGESENMLIAHEFRIDEYIKDGENLLTVHIKSATVRANSEDYPLRLLTSLDIDGCYIRKAPHSFGWDIMPRAVTSGLWREVRLEVRDRIYFSQTYIAESWDETYLYYELKTDDRELDGVELELVGSCLDSTVRAKGVCKKRFGRVKVTIDNPKLWFPYGYGDANVYDCKARIYKNGELIHESDFSFGLREVKLERRDPEGYDEGQFRFLINGVEVMCKGSNWVPLDAFHSRDAERYDKALALVKDIGCNILRMWGGNVYEDHKFFDFCDRNGIMVWQDFAMACAQYPETDEFKKAIQSEASAIIRKLRNHPSIIVWSGDNEVDACFPMYDPNQNKITREWIAAAVRDNDIGRPYLPSSPYISPKMYEAGFRSQVPGSMLPEEHTWGPRDYFKSDYYKNNTAHFISEAGYHGCPSLKSIKKFITPDRVWPYHSNPEWILHSSNQDGNDSRVMLMEKQVRQLFGEVPTDPEDYILASQISQAEAKKYFIERMRIGRPKKTGIIWWNLLDGWPQMSDAVVDYFFEKKLAYGYIKRSQAPFTIAADEIASWEIKIYACNDTLNVKRGHFTVKDAESGEILHGADFEAKENASTVLAKLPTYYSEKKMLIIEWEVDGGVGYNHYTCGYPPFSLESYKRLIKQYNL